MDTNIAKRVEKLFSLFKEGKIKRLEVHEVHPELDRASRENYLYFTLPVCINFQRSSPAMWRSAFMTYSDPETNYVFFPEKVLKKSRSVVQTDLKKHNLALQTNKHTDIWLSISRTLHERFHDDPREILRSTDYDILKLLDLFKEHKEWFPYLSGPKLSNYWPFILSQYTDVKFSNMYEISIIPDTHVIQSTIKLGLAPKTVTSLEVVDIWRDLLKKTKISPVEMHPVLWNWSRANFTPEI
jgi:hypothetical protein